MNKTSMLKTISVKELRQNFPAIRQGLAQGVTFEIIYRSRLIARLVPRTLPPTPPHAFRFFAHPPKQYTWRGRESAVSLTRRERGEQ